MQCCQAALLCFLASLSLLLCWSVNSNRNPSERWTAFTFQSLQPIWLHDVLTSSGGQQPVSTGCHDVFHSEEEKEDKLHVSCNVVSPLLASVIFCKGSQCIQGWKGKSHTLNSAPSIRCFIKLRVVCVQRWTALDCEGAAPELRAASVCTELQKNPFTPFDTWNQFKPGSYLETKRDLQILQIHL